MEQVVYYYRGVVLYWARCLGQHLESSSLILGHCLAHQKCQKLRALVLRVLTIEWQHGSIPIAHDVLSASGTHWLTGFLVSRVDVVLLLLEQHAAAVLAGKIFPSSSGFAFDLGNDLRVDALSRNLDICMRYNAPVAGQAERESIPRRRKACAMLWQRRTPGRTLLYCYVVYHERATRGCSDTPKALVSSTIQCAEPLMLMILWHIPSIQHARAMQRHANQSMLW
jgi:hypothetical protein